METLKFILALGVLFFTFLMLITAVISLFLKVPYVPTKKRVMKKMIEVAKLKNNDVVYDLGCGDGRLLFAAEKTKKVKGTGYELAPIPYLLAKLGQFFHNSKVRIKMSNFFGANLKDANIIFCYLGPETTSKLYKKIKHECKKGTRIISNTFSVHGIQPSRIWPQNKKLKLPSIYMYEI